MKPFGRFLLVLIIIALMISSLAYAKKVYIRATTWDIAEGVKWIKEVFKEYEKLHPNVVINVQSITQGYSDKLVTSIAGGTPPDIFMWWDYPRLASLGVLEPLENVVDFSGVYPTLVKWVTYKGHIWGVAKDWTTRVIWYNKKIFDKYGVPYPKEDWTWEDFLETAKKLTHPKDGVYGFAVVPDPYAWEAWVKMNGGDYLSPDAKTMKGYLNSKQTIEAIKFLTDLYLVYGVSPSPSVREAAGGTYAMFESGKLAMIDSGSWFIGYMKARNPGITTKELAKRFGCTFLPHPKGKETMTMLHNAAWVVPKKSKHKDIALDIEKFLAKEGGRVMAKAGWALPISDKVAKELNLYSDPILGVFLRSLPYSVKDPSFLKREDWWKNFSKYIGDAFDMIMLKKMTVEQALNWAVDQSEQALKREGK